MLCHYRHRHHEDPLFLPGHQDVTAWVDFTALAEAGESAGLELCGYTTQAHFLFANDLARFVEDGATAGVTDRLALAQQARLLALPGEMGERFKVLALGRGYHAPLRGFGMRDLRHTL
jgi:SAM-dependent MidA family methyltransferase